MNRLDCVQYVFFCFNEVFASQLRSCACSCCLLKLWCSVGFHEDFAPETIQKQDLGPSVFFLPSLQL